MSVCGVEYNDIDFCGNQFFYAVYNICGNSDTRTAKQSSLGILCGKRIFNRFFNIFNGNESD